jgi:hypothetical protein
VKSSSDSDGESYEMSEPSRLDLMEKKLDEHSQLFDFVKTTLADMKQALYKIACPGPGLGSASVVCVLV